jgi:hypothetical protein
LTRLCVVESGNLDETSRNALRLGFRFNVLRKAGQLGPPVSVAERYLYVVPGSFFDYSQSLNYATPSASITVDDFVETRYSGYGYLDDAMASFGLASVSKPTPVNLRLAVSQVLSNESSNATNSLSLEIAVLGGSGVVSGADFPALLSIGPGAIGGIGGTWYGEALLPGNYNQPYIVNLDITSAIQSLLNAGDQYAEVYIGTGLIGTNSARPR